MVRNLDKYRVRVLCEDRKHFDFVRGFLLSQGIKNAHKFIDIELPEGTQSGEQYVREHFVSEFKKFARSRENILLVVVQDIDKDAISPENVKSELSNLIQKAGLGTIDDSDKILFVFPKRNIETWLVWLGFNSKIEKINEVMNYRFNNQQLPPAMAGKRAGKLYALSRSDESVCAHAPESLVFACKEFDLLCSNL